MPFDTTARSRRRRNHSGWILQSDESVRRYSVRLTTHALSISVGATLASTAQPSIARPGDNARSEGSIQRSFQPPLGRTLFERYGAIARQTDCTLADAQPTSITRQTAAIRSPITEDGFCRDASGLSPAIGQTGIERYRLLLLLARSDWS